MKINGFTMRLRFEKGERKKVRLKVGSNRWSIASKNMTCDLPSVPLELITHRLCCASCRSSCILIDRCLVQSAVSNLFPNQWRCLKLYLPLPVCLICRCVFWLVIMFSGLLLCFLNCFLFFIFCICVCNLLFCFQNCVLFCTCRPPYTFHWVILQVFGCTMQLLPQLFWLNIL